MSKEEGLNPFGPTYIRFRTNISGVDICKVQS